jgi:hypothetical protein
MNEITEKNIIEETIEKGFQKSEMRFLSKEPTMYKDLKKEILKNKEITEGLKSGISEIVRNSIDVQVKQSLDFAGGSFLRELQSLRFSNLDDQTEKINEKRKSMRTIGVQLVEMDNEGNLQLVEKEKSNRNLNLKTKNRNESKDFDLMMHEILGQDDFDKVHLKNDSMIKGSKNNTDISAEPDRDFLFESHEMESKIITRSSKKLRSISPNQPSISGKQADNDNMNYSDYYDGIFSSFLAYSNAHGRNSNSNFNFTFGDRSSNMKHQGGSAHRKRLEVSSGLSQFLKSKIDSFVDEFSKDAVYKHGSVESMIRGMGEMKSEFRHEGNKDNDLKLLKLDSDAREKLILSDLETIQEHAGDKRKK